MPTLLSNKMKLIKTFLKKFSLLIHLSTLCCQTFDIMSLIPPHTFGCECTHNLLKHPREWLAKCDTCSCPSFWHPLVQIRPEPMSQMEHIWDKYWPYFISFYGQIFKKEKYWLQLDFQTCFPCTSQSLYKYNFQWIKFL